MNIWTNWLKPFLVGLGMFISILGPLALIMWGLIWVLQNITVTGVICGVVTVSLIGTVIMSINLGREMIDEVTPTPTPPSPEDLQKITDDIGDGGSRV